MTERQTPNRGRFTALLDRLDQLADRAERIIGAQTTYNHAMLGQVTRVPTGPFHGWRASALSCLHNIFGVDHIHSKLFTEHCSSSIPDDVEKGRAILLAAHEDLAGGHLTSLSALLAADIFTDFIEMADHLLSNGYKDPAASLIGAVLEDGLRRIAIGNEIKLRERDDISALNSRLAQAEIYSRLTQKRVQVWADIRNKADHGNFEEYDDSLVREMLNGVTAFLEEYLV